MIKIAICDDEELVVRAMKKSILEHEFDETISVDGFTTGEELFEKAVAKHYDIVFMDIELNPEDTEGIDGMELSNKIKDIYPEVIVVFFTGNAGYEKKLLAFEPFRFLPKPVRQADVVTAVKDAVKRIRGWEDKHFRFTKDRISYRISIKRIISVMSARPYIEMHCIDDKISFRGKLDNVEAELGELSADFLRVSKSCLVNRNYVKSFSSKEVVMTTGESVPISRKYQKEFSKMMQN